MNVTFFSILSGAHRQLRARTATLGCCFVALIALPAMSYAQLGNDNPTGPSGVFNGNITTGCSYDAYTGNAMRRVTDIVVAGAVGDYSLAFTRTANSRFVYPNGVYRPMADSGGWRHSYQWEIDGSEWYWYGNFQPSSYPVYFPDGRFETFWSSTRDTYYRAGAGVADRFVPLNLTTMLAYVVLPDGGKVEFVATQHSRSEPLSPTFTAYFYTYKAQAIIDPHGLRTVFTYNGDGTLNTIQEPAGRWIQLVYATTLWGSRYVDHLSCSDGRTVQYHYSQSNFPPGIGNYDYLDTVTYYGDPSIAAHYTYQAPNVGSSNGTPLLASADDPMYAGAMKNISYTYATGVNGDNTTPTVGQIRYENDGATGQWVSNLQVVVSGRAEAKPTRPNNSFRNFWYGEVGTGATSPQLTAWTDFVNFQRAGKRYDSSSGFINAFIDRNGHTTDLATNPLTGKLTQITYPLTPNDTPSGTARGAVRYSYGGPSCADPNNQDANNPYYLCTATDEAGNTTGYIRDAAKRVIQINYPDGGRETFQYNGFGQVTAHGLNTGGTEGFAYDANGRLTSYRDAYHDPIGQTGSPNFWYQYTNSLGLLSDVTDGQGTGPGDLNYTTHYDYNSRGQVTLTTLPTDPVDHTRHTIQNVYNSNGDGTLVSVTDPLGHATSYTYDDYRRLRSATSPGHNTTLTTYTFYDNSGVGDDYTHTDSLPTFVKLPSGHTTATIYDYNLRVQSVTAGYGTSDAATTTYTYDYVGNVLTVTKPNQQAGQQFAGTTTTSTPDERNRIASVTDALSHTTSFMYDGGGRKYKQTRPNGQVITFDSYDAMNRLLQQTSTQSPDPTAVTKYGYYTSGLLQWMQDPRLVALNSADKYSYDYDLMGRKRHAYYPHDANNNQTTETFAYDTPGRLYQFTNRAGNVQTFQYDSLNRQTRFDWNDGVTPSQTTSYDAASRVTQIWNSNATVVNTYTYDNLLASQEEWTAAENVHRVVTYTYDADGNRQALAYPNNSSALRYSYTARDQLETIGDTESGTLVSYAYDRNGNLATRTPNNSTSTSLVYDAVDDVTRITHSLSAGTRTLDYGYDAVGNRKWVKRDGAYGDAFGYDQAEQVVSALLNVWSPDTTGPGPQKVSYDGSGNRTQSTLSGQTETYAIDNSNQYTADSNRPGGSYFPTYNGNGDVTRAFDGKTYTYDAQNRLTSAGGTTFRYDGLNRAISHTGTAILPSYAASRKVHGPAGTFDVVLPITGSPGVECRSGGSTNSHQIVVSFPRPIGFASAYVSRNTFGPPPIGPAPFVRSATVSADGTTVAIDLESVADQQEVFVNLVGVTDGLVMNNVVIPIVVLLGDTNGNGKVDSSDLVTAAEGTSIMTTTSNYRSDVNVDGRVDPLDDEWIASAINDSVAFISGVQQAQSAAMYFAYDGWDAIAEYAAGASTPTNAYVFGPGGLLRRSGGGFVYYYHDAMGSTSHVANSNGTLVELYRYDIQGTPMFFGNSGQQLSASAFGVRHLFTGQQWYGSVGLYDLRNRFYSPDMGRFLEPDPIGFKGDATNLYRYCGNNPVNLADPTGLWTVQIGIAGNLEWGWVSGSWNIGIAFDGHGNIAGFSTGFGGLGAGGDAGAGITLAGSTADTVEGLGRDFKVLNGSAGLGPHGSGQLFWGQDPTNGRQVYGVGGTFGPGIGGGGSGGASYTWIYPFNYTPATPATQNQSSNIGSSSIDPNICPECDGEVQTVVVIGTDPNEYGAPTSFGYIGTDQAGGMYRYPGASAIAGSTMQPTGMSPTVGAINGSLLGAFGSNVPAAAEDGVYWSLHFQGFR